MAPMLMVLLVTAVILVLLAQTAASLAPVRVRRRPTRAELAEACRAEREADRL